MNGQCMYKQISRYVPVQAPGYLAIHIGHASTLPITTVIKFINFTLSEREGINSCSEWKSEKEWEREREREW